MAKHAYHFQFTQKLKNKEVDYISKSINKFFA